LALRLKLTTVRSDYYWKSPRIDMKFLLSFSLFLVSFAPVIANSDCIYDYDPSATTLEWTAFKFTEKTGVKGSFDTVRVTGTTPSKETRQVLPKLGFSIDPNQINSGVPDRDEKIKSYFFNTKQNKSPITGKFFTVSDGISGTAILNLKFNGKEANFPVKFNWKEESVTVTGTIDVLELGLGSGLQKLNEACLELHRGSDGKSKLWPTVDVKIETKLKKTCK